MGHLYCERLAHLENLSRVLATLNVGHTVRRHVPLTAGSDPTETTQPVIVVCGTWVRVSRWAGKPFYVWPDLVHRYPCTNEARDRLASMIALVFHTDRADDARTASDVES